MLFSTLPLLFAATALASPVHQHSRLYKRACAAGPDTPAEFLSYTGYSDLALNAVTPPGYTNTFTNLQASSSADGYGGYTTLDSYDVASCAAQCTSRANCRAFNIYFERAPAAAPSNCTSSATIKCVFWSGAVSASNAQNTGSTQNNFQIVIAGSNGYVASAISPSAGYSMPVLLNNNAIQAPLDCNGKDTYLGFQTFNTSFDASSDGSKPKTCQFFNTQTWGKSVATNTGYAYGQDVYSVGMSYAYSNATDAGVCIKA
ncbi:hypothetical protein KCU99_g6796, partial [Aureobasidium melanogenum]